jgi:hypothetical protein
MARIRRDLSNPIAGQQFGDLTVIGFHGRDVWGRAIWNFQCKCGTKVKIRANFVVSLGRQKSCKHCSYRNAIRARPPQRNADRNGALVSRFAAGRSFNAIAKECGVTRNIVAGAIHRARLRGELKGRVKVEVAS